MATSFDEIIDMATITIYDPPLTRLYERDEQGFRKYCDGFLVRAIPEFYNCNTSLEYNLQERTFLADLSITEISILADLWVIKWLTRKVDDSSQFELKLQAGSFKNHSSAQNLKEKKVLADEKREIVHQKMVNYQLEHLSDISI